MTGAYLRVKRGDKWETIEVEHLTEEEIKEKFTGKDEECIMWINFLCKQLREQERLLDELVKMGILGREGEE